MSSSSCTLPPRQPLHRRSRFTVINIETASVVCNVTSTDQDNFVIHHFVDDGNNQNIENHNSKMDTRIKLNNNGGVDETKENQRRHDDDEEEQQQQQQQLVKTLRRKLSFADEHGKNLETVYYLERKYDSGFFTQIEVDDDGMDEVTL